MKSHDAARILGRRGGQARAASLPAEERRRIASIGGQARSLSRHAAARISQNFRYLRAVDALRPKTRPITRMATFDGTLPRPNLPDAD